MTSNYYPINIDGLTTREAITDCIYRCILAVDTSDETLYDSSYFNSPDALFELAGQMKIQGSEAIRKHLVSHIFNITTLHHVTNLRVFDIDEIEGTAKVACYAMAYHQRPEDAFKSIKPAFVRGARYEIEVAKDNDDGLWKVKTWTIRPHWTDGDRNYVLGL